LETYDSLPSPSFTIASFPKTLIEISGRLPTNITTHNPNITPKHVPSNCCFLGNSLLPTFQADAAGHDLRLAKSGGSM
jgi:hypothetical protein